MLAVKVALDTFEGEMRPDADTSAVGRLHMESVSKLLQGRAQPQHGTAPGKHSGEALADTLRSIGKDLVIPEALIATCNINNPATLHERALDASTCQSLLKQVLNMPVNHGEAASLVRCWTQLPDGEGEETEATIHWLYKYGNMMSLTMVDAPVAAIGVGTVVADGTPAPSVPHMGRNQSDMELTEALWNSGRLCNAATWQD